MYLIDIGPKVLWEDVSQNRAPVLVILMVRAALEGVGTAGEVRRSRELGRACTGEPINSCLPPGLAPLKIRTALHEPREQIRGSSLEASPWWQERPPALVDREQRCAAEG